MRRILLPGAAVAFAVAAFIPATLQSSGAASPSWAMNATVIEACSCPMFCQCFFNRQPAAHATHGGHEGHERYCRGNLVYRVNRGSYNGTKLDGAKFWMAGDLGADLSKGEAKWRIVTFDPSVTKEQREGVLAILPKIYPMKWKSFEIGKDAQVEWAATKSAATARLDGGKAGEVVLGKFQGMTEEPVVIKNLRYVAAPRNGGFILMPSQVEAYRLGDKAFEFKGTNGFMVTIDVNSHDAM
jgi:hypothetical protein